MDRATVPLVRTGLLLPPSMDHEVTLVPEFPLLLHVPEKLTTAVEPSEYSPAPVDGHPPTTVRA